MPTTVQCVMVDYDLDHKAYKLYHPATNKIFVAGNVHFNETLSPLQNTELSH